jgi:hypothetical protein
VTEAAFARNLCGHCCLIVAQKCSRMKTCFAFSLLSYDVPQVGKCLIL